MPSEEGIELRGTEFKVSVTEKRSTGDYENIQPHASVEGEFDGGAALDADRAQLRSKLLALQRDLQAVVERAADNRIKADGHEDWSDPLGGEDGG